MDKSKRELYRKSYLKLADPTEYKFAMKHFDNLQDFLEFRTEYPEFFDLLLQEVELSMVSDAIDNIKGIGNFQSNKFLVEGGWNKGGKSSVGLKVAIAEVKVEQATEDEFSDAIKRMLVI